MVYAANSKRESLPILKILEYQLETGQLRDGQS